MPQMKSTRVANATTLNATTKYNFLADSWRVLSVHSMWTVDTACSATVKLQYSNDSRVPDDIANGTSNAVWEDYAAATNVTGTGSKAWGDVGSTIDALYWRILYTHTSGASDTFKAFFGNINRT